MQNIIKGLSEGDIEKIVKETEEILEKVGFRVMNKKVMQQAC